MRVAGSAASGGLRPQRGGATIPLGSRILHGKNPHLVRSMTCGPFASDARIDLYDCCTYVGPLIVCTWIYSSVGSTLSITPHNLQQRPSAKLRCACARGFGGSSSSRHRALEKPENGTDYFYLCQVSIFAAMICGRIANDARTAAPPPAAGSSSVMVIFVVIESTRGVRVGRVARSTGRR